MEWIIPIWIGFIVVSAVFQLALGWSLSAISQKNEESDTMQVLSWIPLLQMGPAIRAGGGSIKGAILGLLGLLGANIVLSIVGAFLGGGMGTAIATLGMIGFVLITTGYAGMISWQTATKRGLSGWVGLLFFIPFANLVAYPIIAFHDGMAAPHKVGLMIGAFLTIMTTASSLSTVSMFQGDGEFATQFAALAAAGDGDMAELEAALAQLEGLEAELGSIEIEDDGSGFIPPHDPDALPDYDSEESMAMVEPPSGLPNAQSVRALFELQERFAVLEQLASEDALRDPGRRAQAIGMLQATQGELEARRLSLDAETYQELASHIHGIEARIHAGDGSAMASNSQPTRANRGAGRDRTGQPGPAAIPSYSDSSAPPVRPFPVQAGDGCPAGAELMTKSLPTGEEEWCQLGSGLRHGWYARYKSAGQPESMGEYRNGLRVGVWTRFYPGGEIRAQAEFDDGMQHGWLLSFDASGNRTRAILYDQGTPAR